MGVKTVWLIVILWFSLVAALFFNASCSSMLVPELMDTGKTYPYELTMAVDGTTYQGLAVLEDKSSYKMEFIGNGSVAFFLIANCHRTIRSTEVGSKGWLLRPGRAPVYSFTYKPNEIEVEAACPLEISALDKKGGKHSFGFIAFRREELNLPVTLLCSGERTMEMGVSICSESQQLEQGLIFDKVVKYSKGNTCPDIVTEDGKNFRYKMTPTKCQYGFIDNAGRIHRHIALGFSSVLYPEEK